MEEKDKWNMIRILDTVNCAVWAIAAVVICVTGLSILMKHTHPAVSHACVESIQNATDERLPEIIYFCGKHAEHRGKIPLD